MRGYISRFSLLIALLCLAVAGCDHKQETHISVVATTSVMQTAIKDIGGDRVNVILLIAPGSCPGHYDIRPGDVLSIKQSRALFTHGYEQFVPRLMEAVGTPSPKVCKVAVEGNWMVPDVYIRACGEIVQLLSEIDTDHRNDYRDRFERMKAGLATIGKELRGKARKAGTEHVTVICSDQQTPFLEWMGLNVVAGYGRPEEFTPTRLHELADIAYKERVVLVVDNLQSGPTAGSQLAQEIGASHVTLSNFPGGFTDTQTWEKCLRRNVDLVLSALQNARGNAVEE